MLDIRIAELSATAGPTEDGIVAGGGVEHSLGDASYTNLGFSEDLHVLRKDTDGLDVVFTDVTDLALSGTPFPAFGTLSSRDELWISGTSMEALYVEVTTPGEYIGGGVSIWDSPDGEELHEITPIDDESDGFRNDAGIYKISFSGHEDRQSIAPLFGMDKHPYVVIRPKTLGTVTVSPIISNVWVLRSLSDSQYLDFTPTTNGATDNATFGGTWPDTIFYTSGVDVHYGLSFPACGFDDWVYRKTNSDRSGVYQYFATDKTWKDLENFTESGNQLKSGPSTNIGTPTIYKSRWSVPSDWTPDVCCHAPDMNATPAYWIRYYVTNTPSTGPKTSPLFRRRFRILGDDSSYGILHKNAIHYTGVAYSIGTPSTTDTHVQLINGDTGQSVTITIPANTISSGELENKIQDINLSIDSGQSLLIQFVGGGTVQDIDLRLQ